MNPTRLITSWMIHEEIYTLEHGGSDRYTTHPANVLPEAHEYSYGWYYRPGVGDRSGSVWVSGFRSFCTIAVRAGFNERKWKRAVEQYAVQPQKRNTYVDTF